MRPSAVLRTRHIVSGRFSLRALAAILKTAPGVATVVAAAFVPVVDDAKRFRRAHEVESYLGLVRVAAVAVARRLVGVLWAMWRDGTVYEPTRVGGRKSDGVEQGTQSARVRAAALRRAARKPFYSSAARQRAER